VSEGFDIYGDEAVVVAETGIAVVHEGELIYAAPGSGARTTPAPGESLASVEYRFPVEIEVRKEQEDVDHDALVQRAMGQLGDVLGGV
jgi:hypothetical protein